MGDETPSFKDRLKAVMDELVKCIGSGESEVTDECRGRVASLYVEAIMSPAYQCCADTLQSAQGVDTPSELLKVLCQSMQKLTPVQPAASSSAQGTATKKPPPERKQSTKKKVGDGKKKSLPDDAGELSSDDQGESSSISHRLPWVRPSVMKPTSTDLDAIRLTLQSTHDSWMSKEEMISVEIEAGRPRLLAFKGSAAPVDNHTYLPLRHLMLYMTLTRQVFPEWRFNVDRSDRRGIALLDYAKFPKLAEMRESLGLVKVKPTRNSAMMEAYLRPQDQSNNSQKSTLPVVVVDRLTPHLMLRCGGSRVSAPDYIHLLLKSVVPVCAAVGPSASADGGLGETVGEALGKQKRKPTKQMKSQDEDAMDIKDSDASSSSEDEQGESETGAHLKKGAYEKMSAQDDNHTELVFTQRELAVTNQALRGMTEYFEGILPDATSLWLEDAVELQDKTDELLLAAISEQGDQSKTASGLRMPHKKCGTTTECEHRAEHGHCFHHRCDRQTCRSCPILLKNYYYLRDLADTFDFTTMEKKTKEKEKQDMWKVHKSKDETKVKTVHSALTAVRDFSTWYLINLYKLMGSDYLGNAQPTLPTLLLSQCLKKLLQQWYMSCATLQKDTKHRKMRHIRDLISGHLRFFVEDGLGVDYRDMKEELRQRLEHNVEQLDLYMGQVAGKKTQLQQNTAARGLSTDTCKAPPMERVVAAHAHFRQQVWDKLSKARGRSDAHQLPQRILMLALLKMCMGPRPSMLSHMAIGANLRTVRWLVEDESVDHQGRRVRGEDADEEHLKELERYAKVFAMRYKADLCDPKRPGGTARSFEVDYHVNLLALCREWYGHKTSNISARILPFYREMSLEFTDYCASIIWLRSEKEQNTKLAKKYLKARQKRSYDTDAAYDWLNSHHVKVGGGGDEAMQEQEQPVDFLKMVYDEFGPMRVFYRSAEDRATKEVDGRTVLDLSSGDLYGSHTEHHKRGSSVTDPREDELQRYVTDVFRQTMCDYYKEVRPEDIKLSMLEDGTLDVLQMPSKAKKNYTLRGMRSSTADYIKRSCPDMPENIKDLLVNQTLMHKLETHETVYVRDRGYARCLSLRSWVERGMPSDEWGRVNRETDSQLRVEHVNPPRTASASSGKRKASASSSAKKTPGNDVFAFHSASTSSSSSDGEGAIVPAASAKKPRRGSAVSSMGIGQGFLTKGSTFIISGVRAKVVRIVADGSAEYRLVLGTDGDTPQLAATSQYLGAHDFCKKRESVTNENGSQTWAQLYEELTLSLGVN